MITKDNSDRPGQLGSSGCYGLEDVCLHENILKCPNVKLLESEAYKGESKLDMVVHACNPSIYNRQKNYYEIKAILVYISITRLALTTE